MKKSKYIKYLLLKEWLPFIVIFTAIALIGFFLQCASVSLYNCPNTTNVLSEFSISTFLWSVTIFAIAMPFLVFSYRFTTKRNDTYYQLPFNANELKNIRVLTGLLAVVIAFTISFMIPYVFLMVRYGASPAYVMFEGKRLDKESIDFGLMFAMFFIALAAIAIEYFISCFFVSLCDHPLSALVVSAAFHALLVFTMYFAALSASTILDAAGASYPYNELRFASTPFFRYSPGPAFAGFFADNFFSTYVLGKHYDAIIMRPDQSYYYFSLFIYVSIIVMDVVIGVIACLMTLLRKDKSGEMCKKHGFANEKLNPLFLLCLVPAVILSFGIPSQSVFPYSFIWLTFVGLAYFLYVLFNGTFKIRYYNYIIIGAVLLMMFVTPFVMDAIYPNRI